MILQVFFNLNESIFIMKVEVCSKVCSLQSYVWLIFQSGIKLVMPKFKLKAEDLEKDI